jgi:hypothetical protein
MLHLLIFLLHLQIFPFHLVDSKILSVLAYINPAPRLTHEVRKREAAFISKQTQLPSMLLVQLYRHHQSRLRLRQHLCLRLSLCLLLSMNHCSLLL